MQKDFYVGQKVVCLKDYSEAVGNFNLRVPQKGEVYTIRGFLDPAIVPSLISDMIGLYLEEIVNDAFEWADVIGEAAWDIRNFRPVKKTKQKTDISIFKKMLNTKNVKELV